MAGRIKLTKVGHYRVIHQDERDSKSGALIRGIQSSRHSLIVFVDADTLPESTWLRELVTCLVTTNLDAANGNYAGSFPGNYVNRWFEIERDCVDSGKEVRLFAGGTIAIRREIIERHGINTFFSLSNYAADDLHLLRELIRLNYRVGTANRAVVRTSLPTTVAEFRQNFARWFLAYYSTLGTSLRERVLGLGRSVGVVTAGPAFAITLLSAIATRSLSLFLLGILFSLAGLFFAAQVGSRFRRSTIVTQRRRRTFPSYLFLHYVYHLCRADAILIKLLRPRAAPPRHYKGTRRPYFRL
jgi:cellulose synthase/poly-beta-1,6-N-acetylglucosamine synthase-like glycosyltransferase